MDPLICAAIASRRLLMFGYRNQVRVVEPHIHGESTAGNEALSAWLRPGYSRTDPGGGWRMYRVDALVDVQALDAAFDGARPGYNPDDAHFARIYCRLAPAPRLTLEADAGP
jgi:hypothetical protein